MRGAERFSIGVEGERVDNTNVSEFIAVLKRAFPQRKGLLILTSCCLGCYTYLDDYGKGTSLVQKIATETGLTVLSPGGWAGNGSFLNRSGPSDDPDTTRLIYEHDDRLQERGESLHTRNPALIGRSYDSRNNTWYVTTP